MNKSKFKNTLMYGDNLTVMQNMENEFVDLIYLDPPFNSKRDYNAIFELESGLKLPENVAAFKDTWEYTLESKTAFQTIPAKMLKIGIADVAAQSWKYQIEALIKTNESLAAYLIYMTERLIEMHRVLKKTGSIYLHCDPYASHYLKTIMDIIFGHKNFKNEIIWYYKNASRGKSTFAKSHDIIFWYSKTDSYTFNRDDILQPFDSGMTKWRYEKGGQKNKPMPKGKTPDDVITMPSLNTMSKERLGYPTQKPRDLLEIIIKTSSKKGDVIFDPFCGCATTMEAAHLLDRNWLGIDITIFAIRRVANKRLANLGLTALKPNKNTEKEYESKKHYFVAGVPNSQTSAKDLWKADAYQFQKWCIETIGGFVNPKRTADGGVDGRLYFKNDNELASMILEVKGGQGKNINTDVINKLIMAMQKNNAEMAGLIHLEPLTEQMQKKHTSTMAQEGFVEIDGNKYPKVQLLSVADILEGKSFKTPNVQVDKLMSQIEGFGANI